MQSGYGGSLLHPGTSGQLEPRASHRAFPWAGVRACSPQGLHSYGPGFCGPMMARFPVHESFSRLSTLWLCAHLVEFFWFLFFS